jgi:large subunit ribosomal protein L41|tara:strand:+ start:59 stop:343 length:285 start_codon:yes stop_codon:yes gene_type:complete
MFKATTLLLYKASWNKTLGKAATRRQPLTSKKVGKGYYKGMGGTKEGWHTSKGRYVIDPKRQLEIVVPDLTGFRLKPYIAASVSRVDPVKLYGD